MNLSVVAVHFPLWEESTAEKYSHNTSVFLMRPYSSPCGGIHSKLIRLQFLLLLFVSVLIPSEEKNTE